MASSLKSSTLGISCLDMDGELNNSATDWKAKFELVADMLAETRAELDEFHTSSKELEEELIKELERTEKAQQTLKVQASNMETERDEWKNKFISLQTTHNHSNAFLQHELDILRQENYKMKVQLRELEVGNDDLERNERAIASSLVDVEAKYSRALEEKILLEQDLLDKAVLEEECQRLRDELRDATLEITITKEQLQLAQSSRPKLVGSQRPSSPMSSYQSSSDAHSHQNPRLNSLPSHNSNSSAGTSSSQSVSVPETAQKSKGVQMVSEMRARVRNLERKIHSRVPRPRSGSESSQQALKTLSPIPRSSLSPGVGTSSRMTSPVNLYASRSVRYSHLDPERRSTSPAADTSGWVIVMDDCKPGNNDRPRPPSSLRDVNISTSPLFRGNPAVTFGQSRMGDPSARSCSAKLEASAKRGNINPSFGMTLSSSVSLASTAAAEKETDSRRANRVSMRSLTKIPVYTASTNGQSEERNPDGMK